MPITNIDAFANVDVATIVWKTSAPLAGCRGFALERKVKGQAKTVFVPTWVGFKGQAHKKGENRPSTVWPIQRYIWSDYGVTMGQTVRYRVIPMVGPASKLQQAAPSEWSAWTGWVEIGTGQTKGFDAYFNRGIVPAQWLARQNPSTKSLQSDINNKNSSNRVFLSGALRPALLKLLSQAKASGCEIYAALYELNDPELVDALKAIGGKCNLILASGAYKAANKKKGTPAVPDENADVRKDLQLHSKVNVHDRLVRSPHFAHNKFVVFCDKQGKPATLWTGSTNWTVTGLCTQVNNGIHIDNADLAQAYRDRWEDLKNAGAEYPATLATRGSTPSRVKVGKSPVTAWNAPMLKLVDLADAKKRIEAATEGVLFLMFNPGPKNTLLNAVLDIDKDKVLVHGVINQDPGGKKAPLLQPVHRGTKLPAASLKAVLPKGLKDSRTWFDKEFQYNMVMIHSKVVVLDPFGKNPVVMTGSHNLGPKASGQNDDNLVIIENAPGLAAEYAVNILGVYGHYKWLYNESLRTATKAKKAAAKSPQYDGNYDDDKWQSWYTKGDRLKEIDFWLL